MFGQQVQCIDQSFAAGLDITPHQLVGSGLYLVEIAVKKDGKGTKTLVAFRRVFRPSLTADSGGEEPILLSNQVGSLAFRYFGSPEKNAEAAWYPSWTSAKALPLAVEIAVTPSRGPSWPVRP